MAFRLKARVQSTSIPFEYNLNNPMSGYNDWARHIKLEVDKLYGVDKAKKEIRRKELLKAAAENADTGSEEMSRLFNEAIQLINKS